MNDFLANKIIEEFIMGDMTAHEAWRNVRECRQNISEEKFDEISALILEDLIEAELVEEDEDVELGLFFQDESQDCSWLDHFEEEWEHKNPYFTDLDE